MQDSGLFRSHHEYIQVGGDDSPPLREYQSLLGGHSPPPHHLGTTYVDDMNKYHDEDALLGTHHHHHHSDLGGSKDVDLGVGPATTTTIGGFNLINRPGLAGTPKDNSMIKVESDMSQNFNLLPPFMSD